MVYIKRIDLRGFKTFGRKATVRLDQGLTVITGPNGSGKSNILDSLRFALGELSPKELRGASISDLISKTSVANPPKSVYVAVQFDNNDRRLPIDSSSVTISREFHKGGEGIYRINSRRSSRKQLTELLASADINVGGYNIVPQHAITRLAEVTSEERRKIVEDLVGLGIYDARKAEAQVQLNQAETNIRIASARVDEVRLRVESLEKERNDFLRHSTLIKEIARLESQIISNKISDLKKEIEDIENKTHSKESQLDKLVNEFETFSNSRSNIEHELKTIRERLMDKGGRKLEELEEQLSEINSEISRFKAEIDTNKSNLKVLQRQRQNLEEDSKQQQDEINSLKDEILKISKEDSEIEIVLKNKQNSMNELSDTINEIKSSVMEKSGSLEKIENDHQMAREEYVKLNSQSEVESAKLEILREQLNSIKNRESGLKESIDVLLKKSDENQLYAKQKKERLIQLIEEIKNLTDIFELQQEQLNEAEKISIMANESMVEFDAKRNMADILAPDEVAIDELLELQNSGYLTNVIGRFRDLINPDKKFEKAVLAACGDWSESIVVRDISTAFICVEQLKKLKLSRIKIIPLDLVIYTQPISEVPDIEGVLGRVIDCVEYDELVRPAVNYVLGDTVIAESQRAAYNSAMEGFRSVVLNGDLYEAGGILEGGHFREPVDIGTIAPRSRSLNDFKNSLKSLSQLIEKDRDDLDTINTVITRLKDEKIVLEKSLQDLHINFRSIQEKLDVNDKELLKTNNDLRALTEQIQNIGRYHESTVQKKLEIEHYLQKLEAERNSLRNTIRSNELNNIEKQYSELTEEFNDLKRKKASINSKIANTNILIQSRIQTVERIEDQLKYIQESEEEIDYKIQTAETQEKECTVRLNNATIERKELAESLESLRRDAANKEKRIEELDESIRRLEREKEPIKSEINGLNLEFNKKELEKKYLLEELTGKGFKEHFDVSLNDIKRIEENLNVLKHELERIGAINALAVSQYEEQKNNYKQLSIRINEIEEEKRSILKFMNELEQKKRETFMDVFERLNKNFNEIFSKITDGGKGRLVLENPENIFSGGLDMNLAFPGKAELSIGSASGGEKSVSTVCFLLALQGIHPMPFYVFDEIDAHLDMINSQRLADLLRERSKDSQFIVVSLKDTTISRADGVYGIFIQGGFSQVISLPKPEVKTSA
ncbi:chromosome segregation protein SMC [[Eubacterium] cellulosolvens]